MAGDNAIGTGAIVITCSSDAALAGFDKIVKAAKKWSDDTGKEVDKVDAKVNGKGRNKSGGGGGKSGGDSGIGGLLGAVIGGSDKPLSALIGGGIGSVLGGPLGGLAGGLAGSLISPLTNLFGSITGSVSHLLTTFDSLGSKADALRPKVQTIGDLKNLDSIALSVDRVDHAVDQLEIKFLGALAPAVNAVSGIVLAALDRWAPSIDKIAAGFGAFAYTFVDVGGQILGQLLGLTSGTDSWASTTQMAESKVIAACQEIAVAFANVWDGLQAGGAIALKVFSNMVFGMNCIVTAAGDVAKAMEKAFGGKTAFKAAGTGLGAGAGLLLGGGPTTFSGWAGAGLGGLAGYSASSALSDFDADKVTNNMARMQVGLDSLADRLGKAGGSANIVAAMFAGLGARFDNVKGNILNSPALMPTKLTGAFQDGSKDAYSVVAQYTSQGRDMADKQKQLIDAVKAGNALLNNILGALVPGAPPIILKEM